MRKIEKPKEGEYAPYTIMYFGLLPDDGLVLKHLRDNLQATKDFILSLPAEKLHYATRKLNGQSRKFLRTSLTMNAFMSTALYALREKIKPNCQALNRMIMRFIQELTNAISKIF
jgi:hypothetical protein